MRAAHYVIWNSLVVWNSLFLLGLSPLLYLGWGIATGQLGPDPGKELVLFLGIWAIRFLALSLTVTPLVQVFHLRGVQRYRRMIGLYCWFYAGLHLTAFLLFLLDWQNVLTELLKRPYIAVGMLAFLILSAMGITSNTWMMRKLGKRWKRLHKTVYIAAPLICLHFIWTVRSDYGEAIFYTGIFVILLGFRLWKWQSAQKRSSGLQGTPSRV